MASADDDRILRRFLNLIVATLRTNFFQTDAEGGFKPYLSLKLDSRAIEDLPLPTPWVETFVYSPRVEAVHLRGGRVARGGIRWSDRARTSAPRSWGLMKAQMVKNAVIIPVGAKGGFVVKRPPADGGREALLAEGVECYRMMMRGLLDITDNLRAGAMMPPPDVVRRDEDDPYLVVAADKGTASFSDIANAVSLDYGFWLGDAFASGGSQGYDHKAMGITARGLGGGQAPLPRDRRDVQAEDFTVVGSATCRATCSATACCSRRTSGSSAPSTIFTFSSIPTQIPRFRSANAGACSGCPARSGPTTIRRCCPRGAACTGATPNRSPSARGAGPFRHRPGDGQAARTRPRPAARRGRPVMVRGHRHLRQGRRRDQAAVGDRANDLLRVDAAQLRCRVVGEGANLAVTQLGRIEYALAGGRINSDAIDNSAGVDTSDHEVNIKILLDAKVADGDMTTKQRNELLTAMTMRSRPWFCATTTCRPRR